MRRCPGGKDRATSRAAEILRRGCLEEVMDESVDGRSVGGVRALHIRPRCGGRMCHSGLATCDARRRVHDSSHGRGLLSHVHGVHRGDYAHGCGRAHARGDARAARHGNGRAPHGCDAAHRGHDYEYGCALIHRGCGYAHGHGCACERGHDRGHRARGFVRHGDDGVRRARGDHDRHDDGAHRHDNDVRRRAPRAHVRHGGDGWHGCGGRAPVRRDGGVRLGRGDGGLGRGST